MKKRLLATMFAAFAVTLGLAGSAAANKNTAVVTAECSNGESLLVRVNFKAGERSGENAATPIVGGGSFKTTEIHLFFEGTEVISVTSNFPHEPTVTCTGTVFEPKEQVTLTFIVSGIPRQGR
jgi:hypothetical protein